MTATCVALVALAGSGAPAAVAAPAHDAPAAGGASSSLPPAPVKFRVTLRLSGGYRYRYTAPTRLDVRELTFASNPVISYDVFLYPAGAPPSYLRTVSGVQRSLTSGMRGHWRVAVTGHGACQAAGTLVDSSSGTVPLLATGSYRRHAYRLTLEAAPGIDPFAFQGTHEGSDPCATSDPWRDWVLALGHPRNGGATTFHAVASFSQRQLRAAQSGRRANIPVHLLPGGRLASSDCGTVLSLGISCRQSLDWSGRVSVGRAR